MTTLPIRLYGLLDCNSFFVSCEKLFRPDLAHKAVVVLSNNDGCVVSRSPEAKQLMIPMGEPFYKIRHLAEQGRVHVFSSNFKLYGDISSRVMRVLNRWTPNIEVYSIDEAFLDLTGSGLDSERRIDFMYDITEQVQRWTGIPVSIGLGTTMTLAKVANDVGKKCGGHCLDINTLPAPRKSIQVSRSFHDATDNYETLCEAVSTFAAKASEKARSEGTVTSGVYVHINTSRFRDAYYSAGIATGFDAPTSNTPTVIHAALELLKQIYRPNELYKKASVILLELQDAAKVKSQRTLFSIDDTLAELRERNQRLMQSLDTVNRTLGKGTLFFGSQGTDNGWYGASEHRSPSYLMSWESLPIAKAK